MTPTIANFNDVAVKSRVSGQANVASDLHDIRQRYHSLAEVSRLRDRIQSEDFSALEQILAIN